MPSHLWMDIFTRMTKDEIKDYQLKRMKWLIKYAYENTSFYKKLYDAKGIKPDDIQKLEDINKLPITTKESFAQSQSISPPFGNHLAVSREKIIRINISTGAKGPAIEPSTENDALMDTEANAFALNMAGVGPEDIFVITSNYSYVPSGLLWQLAGEKVGCATIPIGIGNRERLVNTLSYTKATVLNAFTTYCFQIAETAYENGVDPKKDFALRTIFMGGEPGGGFPSVRKKLRDIYGEVELYERYGTAELRLLGAECSAHDGFHIPEPFNYVEVGDMENCEPVSEGDKGVIIGSALQKDGWPIIRFRTDDISFVNSESCSCGLGFRKLMGILGKTGGIARVKGILVYPEPIAQVISDFHGLKSFQAVVSRPKETDKIILRIESEDEPDSTVKSKLIERLRAVMAINPEIEFIRPGVLPKDAKFKRIIDERHAY